MNRSEAAESIQFDIFICGAAFPVSAEPLLKSVGIQFLHSYYGLHPGRIYEIRTRLQLENSVSKATIDICSAASLPCLEFCLTTPRSGFICRETLFDE